jgi:hypothetical protein
MEGCNITFAPYGTAGWILIPELMVYHYICVKQGPHKPWCTVDKG